ncbi:Pleckstrin-likey domain-containing family F member 2 [Holothuria leucospilota]|uniref:Pleckstrin-likey domain-containing family F member 2 n=1 Tax=Holothuria leucospilota TaxID=206669 RepID=A0A9Q1CS48_HOLLE|nr:Pleckstrin-likey domain-containing family F member 2 [Holothuria leucospilota]
MVDRLVHSPANRKRISVVEDRFGSSGQPLAVPGRVLVGEGVLTKLCRKKTKPRMFFLFNDILVYGNIVIHKKKYNKQHILPLEDVKLKSVDDDGVMKNAWKIISATKSFMVSAATATEKSEWMAHINKCIQDLLTKSGKKPATDLSPVWVPDSEAPVCMSCHKNKFTAINRRHHCRKCGYVICSSCSTKRYLLPQIASRPIRVCDTCYNTLSAGQTGEDAGRSYQDRDSSGEDDDDDDDEEDDSQKTEEEVHPTFYEDNYR